MGEARAHQVFEAIQRLGHPCLGAGRASPGVPESPSLAERCLSPCREGCAAGASVLRQTRARAEPPIAGVAAGSHAAWDLPWCHWALTAGAALSRESLRWGKGWCWITWQHHPPPGMISPGASGLCPGRVPLCRAPPWSTASGAGLQASQEQGGERNQHRPWLPSWLQPGRAAQRAHARPLLQSFPDTGGDTYPRGYCWGWPGGMRGLLPCRLLAHPGSLLCCTG